MEERRRRQRFLFQQPVVLRYREGNSWREMHGVVENAGEVGVLLISESEVPQGAEVEVTIIMPHEVRVTSPGKVVRVEPRFGRNTFALAVECARPFSETFAISASAPNLTLTVLRPMNGDIFILRCEGRIVVGDDGGTLREAMLQLLALTSNIVIDLQRVDYIDSAGLGILTGLFTSAKRRGGDIKLLSPSQPARDVLRRTRLDTVFNVFEKEAEAVAAFSQQDMNSGGGY